MKTTSATELASKLKKLVTLFLDGNGVVFATSVNKNHSVNLQLLEARLGSVGLKLQHSVNKAIDEVALVVYSHKFGKLSAFNKLDKTSKLSKHNKSGNLGKLEKSGKFDLKTFRKIVTAYNLLDDLSNMTIFSDVHYMWLNAVETGLLSKDDLPKEITSNFSHIAQE